ncbi:MAG: Ig-like domain-containing protein, partial [Solirubrobacterales bacterium]
PTVSSISTPAPNASPGNFTYTVTFSESVTGLTADDFRNASTATGCTFTPASSSGTTVTVTATGCSSGGVAIKLASGSVSDLAGNTGPATAYTATVVRNGTRQQPQFKINSLGSTPYTWVDAVNYTGDDRGGMAITTQKVLLTGDTYMGRFDLSNLGSPAAAISNAPASWPDGLASDLRTRTAYSFDGPNYGAGSGMTGTVTGLTQLDPATGLQTSTKVTLSQPISLLAGSTIGVFSGYGRIVLWAGGTNPRVYDIEMPSGIVDDLGVRAAPAARTLAETPGNTSWGTAEYFDGQLYLNYVESQTRIVRMKVSDGTTTTLGSFPNGLGDMASFTVDPSTNRWYFHFENSAPTFPGGTNETIGFSVASFTTGPGATWGATPSTPTSASSLTFPLDFST